MFLCVATLYIYTKLPWVRDPHFFINSSKLNLLKKSQGWLEVGLPLGGEPTFFHVNTLDFFCLAYKRVHQFKAFAFCCE